MNNIEKLHIQHGGAESEVQFLKKELQFLLKILGNCYSSELDPKKIKLLDAYWKAFEHNISKLEILGTQVRAEEIEIGFLLKNELIDLGTNRPEDAILAVIKIIHAEIKTLKVSFYEFMHGCSACAFKSSETPKTSQYVDQI